MSIYPMPGSIVICEWIQKIILEKLKSRLSDLSSQELKIGNLLKDHDLIKNINYPPAQEGIIRNNIRYLIEKGFVKCNEPIYVERGASVIIKDLSLSAEVRITDAGKNYLNFINGDAKKKKEKNIARQIPFKKTQLIPYSLIGILHELKGQFCLFVGAGASASAGIPCGKDLQKKILHKLYNELNNYPAMEAEFRKEFGNRIKNQELTLEIIFQGLKEKFGRSAFKMLKRELNKSEGLPSGYYSLAYLVQHGFFKVIFTVNIDELLENLLNKEIGLNKYSLICESDRFKSLTPTPIKNLGKLILVKLHGTYSLESTLIISWQDVQKLPYEKEKFLEYYASNYPMIFVGFSGRDPDIKSVLQSSSNKSKDYKIFWISPNELEEDAKEILTFYNSSSNHIKMNSDDFFDELEHRLIGGYPCLDNQVSIVIHESGAFDYETSINCEEIMQEILKHPSWGYEIGKRYQGKENRLKRDIKATLQYLVEKGYILCDTEGTEKKYWD